MKLLVIDGNSIVNRAFYGIKSLSTKDGQPTNAIYGFLNILLKLKDDVKPDAVAVAFDLKAPTFRHKMYADYKSNRKGMPEDLAKQMEPLKEIISAMGYTMLSSEGWEADDILGTLAGACGKNDECYIATGDRDSLQLIDENVKVLLATNHDTVVYDIDRLKEEYGVSPKQMIDIKALMGDSSDCIPGVAGVGKKTAGDLIIEFGSIDYIYENIDSIDIRDSLRNKLKNDKDMAFLSYKLGTISRQAPVSTDLEKYRPKQPSENLARLLARLELFKIIKKLELSEADVTDFKAEKVERPKAEIVKNFDYNELLELLKKNKKAYFCFECDENALSGLAFNVDNSIYHLDSMNFNFNSFVDGFIENEEIKKYTHNSKKLYSVCINMGLELKSMEFDTLLASYLLNPSASDYEISRLVQEYEIITPEIDGEAEPLLKNSADILCLCEELKNKIAENNQQKLLD
ncbi:MAG: DNA polymerase I, partial [Clostridiales bacterium]|nr:DNA polymerase I [Clostridiales bacterium]